MVCGWVRGGPLCCVQDSDLVGKSHQDDTATPDPAALYLHMHELAQEAASASPPTGTQEDVNDTAMVQEQLSKASRPSLQKFC